jgi:hypothetical protein
VKVRETNNVKKPIDSKPSGCAELQTWGLQISNFITGGNSNAIFRKNILNKSGGPQQAETALYFASLNQAWPLPVSAHAGDDRSRRRRRQICIAKISGKRKYLRLTLTTSFQNMIAQVSREMKMVRWSCVPLLTQDRTRAVHDGNDVNNPEQTP